MSDARERERLMGEANWKSDSGSLPVFQSPWEAKAFAMVVHLSESGCFSWAEWVERLAAHLAAARDATDQGLRARSYAECWVDAAESLLIAKGITSAEQLQARRLGAWPLDMAHARNSADPAQPKPVSVC